MNYARDIAYAKLCQDTYTAPDIGLTEGGIGGHFAFAAGAVDGQLTLCFRGSKLWLDWLADLFAFPLWDLNTLHDLRLGPVHAGFLIGAQKLLPDAQKLTAGRPYALVGHSLGGALATVLGGLLTAAGTPPEEIVTFGAPRAGCQPLVTLLQHVAIRQYVFATDPVPHVPTNPPFIQVREPLLHIGKPVQLISPFSNHHIQNYLDALSALQVKYGPEAGNKMAG